MLNNPQKINPALYLNLEEIEVDGKTVLYVYVSVSSHVEFCSGKIFDRNFEADIDITHSTDLVAHLYNIKSGQFSERQVFPYAMLDDMRLDLIPKVKQMALTFNKNHPWKDMTDMEFFRSAELYENDKMGGKEGFNLAGILLFGRDEVARSCAAGLVTDCCISQVKSAPGL
jgi:ATP-dependent DNA helicase RecG